MKSANKVNPSKTDVKQKKQVTAKSQCYENTLKKNPNKITLYLRDEIGFKNDILGNEYFFKHLLLQILHI